MHWGAKTPMESRKSQLDILTMGGKQLPLAAPPRERLACRIMQIGSLTVPRTYIILWGKRNATASPLSEGGEAPQPRPWMT